MSIKAKSKVNSWIYLVFPKHYLWITVKWSCLVLVDADVYICFRLC